MVDLQIQWNSTSLYLGGSSCLASQFSSCLHEPCQGTLSNEKWAGPGYKSLTLIFVDIPGFIDAMMIDKSCPVILWNNGHWTAGMAKLHLQGQIPVPSSAQMEEPVLTLALFYIFWPDCDAAKDTLQILAQKIWTFLWPVCNPQY